MVHLTSCNSIHTNPGFDVPLELHSIHLHKVGIVSVLWKLSQKYPRHAILALKHLTKTIAVAFFSKTLQSYCFVYSF